MLGYNFGFIEFIILIMLVRKMTALTHIHLRNFKSFKNTKLKIPSGFTAILGPNGSGKSNTIDGICFVLGKTSAKSLRAGKFNELITYHNGKREEFAEVTLFFDNKDRKLPIDSDKVGISRKVKINGDNNYYVIWYEEKEVKEKNNNNGEKGTVKKLVEKRKRIKKSQMLEMISKISLSADGPNIILQGDLIRLIEMSPVERRKVIDEISGVVEFDEKKEKSRKELEKAREFIEKIDIRINEVRSNLEKLKKDKEDAEKYMVLNKELKATKYILTSKKIELLNVVLEDIQEQINALNELKDNFQNNVYNIDSEILNLKNKLEDLINELNEKGNEEVIELHRSIKELELNVENDKKHLNNMLDDLKTTKIQIESKNTELTETRTKIETIRKETMEKEGEIHKIKEEMENLEVERGKLKSKVDESETQIRILKQQEQKVSENINEYQKELYELRSKLNSTENEINKKSFDLNKNCEIIDRLKEELESIESNTEDTKDLYKKLEDIAVELEFSKKQLKKLEEDKKTYQNKLDSYYSEYAKENARIKALKEMENFNINRTVKSVLDARLPGVVDIVGNLGKTKTEYKTAIEIAGGGRLNYIVVKRMDDGARAIEYLKRNKLGRATFLPMDRIRGPECIHIGEEGVIGRAIDLVEFKEEFKDIFKYVFGNTIIVKDLDTAKRLSKTYKARFVTLDGDVIEQSGAMIGGSVRRTSNIKVEIDTSKLEKIAEELKTTENELSNVKKSIDELNRKISTYSSKKMELENKLNLTRKNELRREEVLKKNSIKIKELELENKKLEEELEYLDDLKVELESKIEELDKKIGTSMSQRERILGEIKSFESSEYIVRIRKIEDELESLKNKRDKLENEIKRDVVLIKEVLIPKISELNEKIKELNEKKNMLEKNIGFYKSNIEKNTEILRNKRTKYEELTKDLKELTEKKENYEKKIEELNNRKKELTEKISNIDKEINNLSIDRAKYETKLEEEERKLYLCENIEDIEDDTINKLSSMDTNDLERYLIDLENEIKKLEPVNMRAIEDYEFIVDRYNELFEKRNEYEKDEKKYLQLIEEVEMRKKEVFMDVFNKVAKNYEEIYREIGGTGKLSLENPDNPFEGGLLIDASPMNKQLQSLDVMSGGEKSLTALAFLFAIQRLNPAPFYVLDEVDAALDTKNASLIGEMIKNASKDSQFIVISHREQMISKADTLYGVCMENGLSKIVGVKL